MSNPKLVTDEDIERVANDIREIYTDPDAIAHTKERSSPESLKMIEFLIRNHQDKLNDARQLCAEKAKINDPMGVAYYCGVAAEASYAVAQLTVIAELIRKILNP